MEFSFKLCYKCFIVRTLAPPPPVQIANTICRSHFKSNAFLSVNVFSVFSHDVTTTRWIVKTFYVSYSFGRSWWPRP